MAPGLIEIGNLWRQERVNMNTNILAIVIAFLLSLAIVIVYAVIVLFRSRDKLSDILARYSDRPRK
jgi:hypothetical protein